MTRPFQHVVLMKFPHALSAEDEQWARTQVASWPERIGPFRQLRFGADLTGERSRGNHYLLFEEFDDLETFQTYLAHPVHKEFLAWVVAREVEVIAFDYYVDSDTDMLADGAG